MHHSIKTILFWFSLVALAATSGLAIRNYVTVKSDQHRQDQQQIKLCRAIQGAVGYWTEERKIIIMSLAQPGLTKFQQLTKIDLITALDNVITSGNRLECH